MPADVRPIGATRFWINVAVVAVITLVGMTLVVLVYYRELSPVPWRPLGIATLAFGAVGVVVMTVVQAVRTEDREAHPPR
jgi:hypothetical protein